MSTPVWIVGATGLLGSSIAGRMAAAADWDVLPTVRLPWSDPGGAAFDAAVAHNIRLVVSRSAAAGVPWAIVWCAGVAVTGSTPEQLGRELAQLEQVLSAVSRALDDHEALTGAIFYSSSAGGLYAGASNPPFTEETTPAPLAPYGAAKLRGEDLVRKFGRAKAVKILIGRIANLYGPGQSIAKSQGLITQLAKANLSTAPASIYVPLETTRDYIFVDDCAGLIVDGLRRLLVSDDLEVTKIFASHQAVTISALLGYFTSLHKTRPNVMLGVSSTASYQAIDLRLQSTVWTDLDKRDLMPLPAGIQITSQALIDALQEGSLVP